MVEKINHHLAELRAKAERKLAKDRPIATSPQRADQKNLIQELDVHRIELEMQNEELRLRQVELEESKSRYLELYELAPVAFLTLSPAYPYKILGANSMASYLLGAPRAELLDTPFVQFAARREVSALEGFMNALKSSEGQRAGEVRMRRKSPPPLVFFARIQARRVTDARGRERVFAAVSDITDLREWEQELKRANAALALKNKELQDFAFIASHDLREPVRKVQTFASLLEERCRNKLNETELDYLKRMTRASERMELLLASLLDYARLNTGSKPFEKVDLNETLAQVGSNLAEEIERKKGRLQIGDLPCIEAEPQQMQQLFQNLLSNALKYSERPPEITVYSENGSGHSTIYVVDNGIGFELRYLDKIFVPFQRLHGKEKFEGTGMGLTICRKIVERHNGHITATSTPGTGSVFIVTLPYRQE